MATELKHADKASQKLIIKAENDKVTTVWDRYESMQPQCKFGKEGVCCRICSMGPCRISKKNPVGVCGANVDTIAARNLIRMIAGGAAAHSDHGRNTAHTLLMVAEDQGKDYTIKDENKLKALAGIYGIETDSKDIKAIAKEVALQALNDFGKQVGEVTIASIAPEARKKVWKEQNITPRSIDREIVEVMHRTTMGVDAEYKNVIKHGMRTALADGWGGSMIASEISDALFGSPNPLRSAANLGVLKPSHVNLLVHGHEPTLSDIIAIVSQKKELVEKAKAKGAEGITVAGICCTANEILMRHGIPVAGSFLQQELAVVTGAVDLMVVDVQCLMPGLSEVTGCYHTKLITTSPKAKMPGVEHLEFHEDKAVETAMKILDAAIENYPNRKSEKIAVPDENEKIVAGFTAESVYRFLGGTYRSTYRPLNDAIISGRLRGAAGVIGCSNPNVDFEEAHIAMVKELIKNDTLVVTTGCNAISCAKHGLLRPETAFSMAGKGLQEVCRAVGIPPVLHVGSCVDNSRILRVITNILAEGGLGEDLSDLPVAGAAPEWMSEKAVAIGSYFVASGVFTVIGHPLPVMGSENLAEYLTNGIEMDVGGKWHFELDPVKAAHAMLAHIDTKRKALKLKPMIYEQAFGES
ncbi:MAG: anaerobic carbon-monoxide dehydrogenase catalytic subunit [Chitinivibrionales bacterium]|nr:anaerobic carbon-monoxide dehydrogenase catalytic subunit [Chitinivibrionales bacterium]